MSVWHEPGKKKRAISKQDLTPVPDGSAFEVVPQADRGFVDRSPNALGAPTYTDDVFVNDEPGAVLSVTQNWNPGGRQRRLQRPPRGRPLRRRRREVVRLRPTF